MVLSLCGSCCGDASVSIPMRWCCCVNSGAENASITVPEALENRFLLQNLRLFFKKSCKEWADIKPHWGKTCIFPKHNFPEWQWLQEICCLPQFHERNASQDPIWICIVVPHQHMHLFANFFDPKIRCVWNSSVAQKERRGLWKFAPNMPRKQDASGKLSAPRGYLSASKKKRGRVLLIERWLKNSLIEWFWGRLWSFGEVCCKTFFNDKANVMWWCTDKTFSLAGRMTAGAVWEYLIIFRFLCLHCPKSLLHQLREEDNPGRLTLRLFWTGMPKSIPKPDEVQLDLPCNGLMFFVPTKDCRQLCLFSILTKFSGTHEPDPTFECLFATEFAEPTCENQLQFHMLVLPTDLELREAGWARSVSDYALSLTYSNTFTTGKRTLTGENTWVKKPF